MVARVGLLRCVYVKHSPLATLVCFVDLYSFDSLAAGLSNRKEGEECVCSAQCE